MTARAKFIVNSITRSKNWDKSKSDLFTVKLMPVTGTSEENKAFFASTPGGSIELVTINETAANALPLGGEVYVDFTPAQPEAPAA